MATMLRPMNTSELLDRTFFLYRKHFVLFVAIVAIPNLVPLLFRLTTLGMLSKPTLGKTVLVGLISAVFYLLTLAAAQAATVAAVSEFHLGRQAQIGTAFLRAKECLFKIILIAILMAVGVILGCILLIVPGIVLALGWSLAVPAAVIERQGPLDAMLRSWRLTRGSRFRIFLVLVMVTILSYIITVLFQVPVLVAVVALRAQTQAMMPAWVSIYSLVAGFVSMSLVVPVSTIATSLIYYDQRVRKEGFDIQFMISALKNSQSSPIPSGTPSQI